MNQISEIKAENEIRLNSGSFPASEFFKLCRKFNLEGEVVGWYQRLALRPGFHFFPVKECRENREIFRGIWVPEELIKKWRRQLEDRLRKDNKALFRALNAVL